MATKERCVKMGKVDANKKLKENSLLKTAFEYFTTKGFSKTSITDIVSKAGVAKGTFYLYFKDKYDIRNKLVSHKSSQLFKNAITTPVSEDDVNFSEVYYKMLDESPNGFHDPEIMLFMIIELVSSTCYSAILYNEPCTLEKLKPYLYSSIRLIISQHENKE